MVGTRASRVRKVDASWMRPCRRELSCNEGVMGPNPEAAERLWGEFVALIEADPVASKLPVCMAKTQYSLSHDPMLKGRPRGWRLPVRDFLTYGGAGFVVPVCGDIKLMPGTASNPAFRNIDVDCDTGRVRGLF